VIKFLFKRWRLDKKWHYTKAELGDDGKPLKEAKSVKLKVLAIWLRESLLKLGPTFIKVGQQVQFTPH
jgi:predicted unusual protein kinase regulating ubiquinone biosynthesis (AarF/ABC1/UbiB family)